MEGRPCENTGKSPAKGSFALGLLPWIVGVTIVVVGLKYGNPVAGAKEVDIFQNDAKIGKVIDFPFVDVFGRRIDVTLDTLVVLGGSCTSCSINSVYPSKFKESPFDSVVLVYVSTEKDILAEVKDVPAKVKVIADPNGQIKGAFGAISSPRYYVLRQSKLLNVWKNHDKEPTEWIGSKK